MAEAPKIRVIDDNETAGDVIISSGTNVIILAEANSGLSLNLDNVLIRIDDESEIDLKLGRTLATQTINDQVRAFLDQTKSGLWVGRVTGAGGAKAASAAILDFQGVPVATAQFRSKRLSADDNRFSVRVSRGRYSTSDTGAGRIDTKIELLIAATLEVIGTINEANMDVASENYALTAWNNNFGDFIEMIDAAPSGVYTNTTEPAVGTYALSGGTDPAAASSTERGAAALALADLTDVANALVGAVWTASDVTTLANAITPLGHSTLAHLGDLTTPSAASIYTTALPASSDIAVSSGWGAWWRNKNKRLPGLVQVLAQAVISARPDGNRSYNKVGANIAVKGWSSFDSNVKKEGFAAANVNPLFYVSDKRRKGVIIRDVLSQSLDPRYRQWSTKRAQNMIVADVTSFLETDVLLRDEYLFGNKVAGVNADISVDSFARADAQIEEIFAQYPASLLTGKRGKGWDWRGDVINGTDGPEPVFYLGLSIGKVARIIWLRIGKVEGRFVAVEVEATAVPGGN